MSTYTINFNDVATDKIQRLLEYVGSLDFVHSVEHAQPVSPAPKRVSEAFLAEANGFLSVSDIKKMYPNQWVLLTNFKKEGTVLLGGQVLCHDGDKRQFALKAKDLIKRDGRETHFFTGEIPKRTHSGLARKISR